MTDEHLTAAYLSGLTSAYARNSFFILQALRRFLAARQVTLLQASESDLLDFRRYSLTTRKTEDMVNLVMWSIRRFYEWCQTQGHVTRNPAASFKVGKSSRRPPPTQRELECLRKEAAALVEETRRHSK